MAHEIGNKLLSSLKAALKRDPLIDEYDFLYVEESVNNKCPVVVENHKLGVELWAAKLLYVHAYHTLFNSERRLSSSERMDYTMAVLLVNPDCASAWNMRKKLVLDEELTIEDDLRFGGLILTKHAKSPETFAHRKWLLIKLKSKLLLLAGEGDTSSSDGLECPLAPSLQIAANKELKVCGVASERHPNNYNAWTHRIWLLDQICRNNIDIVSSELEQMLEWVNTHVSDYSGFHYRQHLLMTLASTNPVHEKKKALDDELELTTDLIITFPGHEAIWCHRRFVVYELRGCHSSQSPGHMAKKSRTEDDQHPIYQQESTFSSRVKEACMGDWQDTLADKYQQWLDRLFNIHQS